MKKIIILSFIFFASIATYSQSNTGFTVGSNFAFLTGDSTSLPFSSIKPGVYAGLFWDINTGYKRYMQIGAFYSQQGVQYKEEFFGFGTKTTNLKVHKIDYVKIPILWKQVWGDWYTSVGMYGEIAARSNSYWKITEETAGEITDTSMLIQSFTNELRLYDAGLALGLGIQTPLTTQYDFFLNVGYNHGILAVNPKVLRIENKMYNRFFTVNVGLIINSKNYKYKSRR